MPFAKPFFDVGLFTNRAQEMREFYRGLGLAFDHTLKLGGGVLQHRYQAEEAILKINDSRHPLPHRPAGSPLVELVIATPDCTAPRTETDPDGNRVTLVPPGHQQLRGLAVRLAVSSPELSSAFYQTALGFSVLSPGILACGKGLLMLEQTKSVSDADAAGDDPLAALGLRYLTVQVFDCDTAYAEAVAAGATAARAPETLGNTARIAFVRDPDGTWIELSERASVTGRSV